MQEVGCHSRRRVSRTFFENSARVDKVCSREHSNRGKGAYPIGGFVTSRLWASVGNRRAAAKRQAPAGTCPSWSGGELGIRRPACGGAQRPRAGALGPRRSRVAPSRVRIPIAGARRQKGRRPLAPAPHGLAESWGFEPQIGSLLYSLSRRAPSASRSALRDVVLTNHTPTDGLLQHKLIEERTSPPQCRFSWRERHPRKSVRRGSRRRCPRWSRPARQHGQACQRCVGA